MAGLNKRARKRIRQEKEAAQAAEDFRYGRLAAGALRAPGAFGDIGDGLVDVEVIPDFTGRPEGMFAWLIFQTREQAHAAKDAAAAAAYQAHARQLLAGAGFPPAALPSFALGFTSESEIEEGGGRFHFFR